MTDKQQRNKAKPCDDFCISSEGWSFTVESNIPTPGYLPLSVHRQVTVLYGQISELISQKRFGINKQSMNSLISLIEVDIINEFIQTFLNSGPIRQFDQVPLDDVWIVSLEIEIPPISCVFVSLRWTILETSRTRFGIDVSGEGWGNEGMGKTAEGAYIVKMKEIYVNAFKPWIRSLNN